MSVFGSPQMPARCLGIMEDKLTLKEKMIIRQKAASEFSAGLLVFLSLVLIAALGLGLFFATQNG